MGRKVAQIRETTMATKIEAKFHVSEEVFELLRDVAIARLVAKKGAFSVAEIVEQLIEDAEPKLELEAEAIRGPKRAKAVRIGVKG